MNQNIHVLNLRQLGKAIAVNPSHLSNIFCGRRRASPEVAAKLEAATGIDRVEWLYKSPDLLEFLKPL